MKAEERAERYAYEYPAHMRESIKSAWLAGYKARNEFEFDYSQIPIEWVPVMKAWFDYKKTKNKAYKSNTSAIAAYKKLCRLSQCNIEMAMQIIEDAIANGYDGFFKLKNNGDTGSNNRQSAERLFQLADHIF